jgi:hypothetical protein
MTREEQIRQASIEYTYQKQPMYIGGAFSEIHDFEEGAKWADANPNLYNDEKYHTVKVSCLDELNRKAKLYDTFLEKACEWLNNINTDNYMDSGVFQMYNLVLDFKQAMEE